MVIYPNGHNLWFGGSIYCYFDMIFTKILIKNKFPYATCNHPPSSNCNSIDSKCHISFHTSTSFQFQEPWHHLGDFSTYTNEIIQFAKDHPCNQRNDFECHHIGLVEKCIESFIIVHVKFSTPCIMASFISWLDIKLWTKSNPTKQSFWSNHVEHIHFWPWVFLTSKMGGSLTSQMR
jgi:hypothetical protein